MYGKRINETNEYASSILSATKKMEEAE